MSGGIQDQRLRHLHVYTYSFPCLPQSSSGNLQSFLNPGQSGKAQHQYYWFYNSLESFFFSAGNVKEGLKQGRMHTLILARLINTSQEHLWTHTANLLLLQEGGSPWGGFHQPIKVGRKLEPHYHDSGFNSTSASGVRKAQGHWAAFSSSAIMSHCSHVLCASISEPPITL